MVKFLDLQKINNQYQQELSEAASRVIKSGWYLLGDELSNFESEYANYCGSKFCVGVGNGLDALRLIIMGYIELGVFSEGNEIIVPENTYIATILAITDNGLKPVFIDADINTYNIDITKIEQSITGKTKAILTVHLYGLMSITKEMQKICKKNIS